MIKKAEAAKTEAPQKKLNLQEYLYAAGRRKTSVARVRLYPKGKGLIMVNDKPISDYFKMVTSKEIVSSPLKVVGMGKDFDVAVKVCGGGTSAQAEAIRHGISRCLLLFDETLRTTLKKAGFLTRDARSKERKKPGLKRARRAPQFSKR